MALEKRKRNIGIQGTKARFPDKRKRATIEKGEGSSGDEKSKGERERERNQSTREEGRRRAGSPIGFATDVDSMRPQREVERNSEARDLEWGILR